MKELYLETIREFIITNLKRKLQICSQEKRREKHYILFQQVLIALFIFKMRENVKILFNFRLLPIFDEQ